MDCLVTIVAIAGYPFAITLSRVRDLAERVGSLFIRSWSISFLVHRNRIANFGVALALFSLAAETRVVEADPPDKNGTVLLRNVLESARRQRKPVLVVIDKLNCKECDKMKNLLRSPHLNKIVSQYVTVLLHNEDHKAMVYLASDLKWKTSTRAPLVAVVSSQGVLVDSVDKVPANENGMKRFSKTLVDGVKIQLAMNSKDRMRQALQNVKALRAKNETSQAIQLLLPFVKDGDEVEDDTAKKLVMEYKLIEVEAEEALDQSLRKLRSIESQLQGAVALERIRRVYGKMNSLKSRFSDAKKQLRKMTGDPKLAAQAKAIDRARAFEESGNKPRAIKAYRQVISRFPDTNASSLSEEGIKRLKDDSSGQAAKSARSNDATGG